jgi:hypothetical protein
MTDRTWTDITGDHDASDPDNWTPSGAPQPGDNLLLPGGSIIDVTDNDLQDDPLVMSGSSFSSPDAPATLNLSDHAQVTLQDNVSALGPSSAIVNVVGTDTLNLFSSGEPPGVDNPSNDISPVTITLHDHARLSGTFDMTFLSSLTISGGSHTRFLNSGVDIVHGGKVVINTDVAGSGTFRVSAGGVSPTTSGGGTLEFGGSVSRGQTVDLSGSLAGTSPPTPRISSVTVDHPSAFRGTIDLHDFSLTDLVGLAHADSWTYKDDMLTILNAKGNVIDRLHVISDAASTGDVHGLSVSKTGAGDVLVSPGFEFHSSLAVTTT